MKRCEWCGKSIRVVVPVYVLQRADDRGFPLEDENGEVLDPPFAGACGRCAERIKAGELSIGIERPRLGTVA